MAEENEATLVAIDRGIKADDEGRVVSFEEIRFIIMADWDLPHFIRWLASYRSNQTSTASPLSQRSCSTPRELNP